MLVAGPELKCRDDRILAGAGGLGLSLLPPPVYPPIGPRRESVVACVRQVTCCPRLGAAEEVRGETLTEALTVFALDSTG